MVGTSAAIAVEGNTDGSYTTYVSAYVDWNHNGSFDAGEGYEIGSITNSTGTDGKQAVGTIVVPASALLGHTRMRVLKRYSSSAAACNTSGYGQAEDYTVNVTDGLEYSVGGEVSGLVGTGLVLQLNGAGDLAIGADGTFTFVDGLAGGTPYTVTVAVQPSAPAQTCAVVNGSGTIGATDVTDVVVSCSTDVVDRIFWDGFEL